MILQLYLFICASLFNVQHMPLKFSPSLLCLKEPVDGRLEFEKQPGPLTTECLNRLHAP